MQFNDLPRSVCPIYDEDNWTEYSTVFDLVFDLVLDPEQRPSFKLFLHNDKYLAEVCTTLV